MFHPTRGGTRGGQDQFKWEDVKEDKHRENYLGNSLLAPVGRWQKGRDLTWYAKAGADSQDVESIRDKKKAEIQSIKDAEAEAMAEALGYKVKRKTETNVTENELKSAISKSSSGAQDDMDDNIKESSAIQGLGFKSRTPGALPIRLDGNSSTPRAAASAMPRVPLIPQNIARQSMHDVHREGQSKGSSSSRPDERESRRKNHKRSRSRSPTRKRHSERERSRSRNRDKSRDRGEHESSRKQRRDRSKDRNYSHERRSRNKESSSDKPRHESDRPHPAHRSRTEANGERGVRTTSPRRGRSRSRSPSRSRRRQYSSKSPRRRSRSGDRSRREH